MKIPKGADPVKAYKNIDFIKSPEARTLRIAAEYLEPLKRVTEENVKHTVVFYGSARIIPQKDAEKNLKEAEKKIITLQRKSKKVPKKLFNDLERAKKMQEMVSYYQDALTIGSMITTHSKKLLPNRGLVVCSGGGPGIMEAANKGAYLAGGKSIGFNISLPFEQKVNRYVTPELAFTFNYFFMRKFWFLHQAEAVIFFPGGFGTLDEFNNVMVLAQTGKLPRNIPIILYGSEFWKNIMNFDKLVEYQTIAKKDLNLFVILDTPEEVLAYLKKDYLDIFRWEYGKTRPEKSNFEQIIYIWSR